MTNNSRNQIEHTAKTLMKRGFPKRASTFASAIGYLRYEKNKKK